MNGKVIGRIVCATLQGVLAAVCLPSLVHGQGIAVEQVAQGTCAEGEWALGDLGISRSECTCTATYGPGRTVVWRFDSELTIREVRSSGPAEGKLRAGDKVVAIDGLLITSAEGGRRWGDVRPGETVQLLVRRDGRERPVEITAGTECRREHELDPDIIELLRELRDSTGIPGVARSSGLSLWNLLPRAWFGFTVICRDCTVRKRRGGEETLWSFRTPPKIRAVFDRSPADRAGLEAGDVLTRIDGIPLTAGRGARRFSTVQPGETVLLTVQREGGSLTVRIAAVERLPTSGAAALSLEELIHSLEQLRGLSDIEEIRAQLELLLRQLRERVPPLRD
ncbi:MAG: PDZ domain-containing protein [Gemmatimonadales bacterium]|nr:PDZ domain-containing protein [Gemmatimonadales bacterium]